MSHTRPYRLLLAVTAASAAAGCDGGGTGPSEELRIVTEALPNGEVGQPYTEGIDAEGGAGGYAWDVVSGSLPAGVVLSVEDLSDDDAVLTGIPEVAGTTTFTVEVTGDGGQADSARYTIEVFAPADLLIETVALPPTVVGGQVEIPLRANGAGAAAITWAVVEGALPPGLELDPTGVIVGAATSVGVSTFTVRASAGGESTFARFTIRVVPHDTSRLRLTVFPVVGIPAAIAPHVEAAVERWEAVLVDDLPGGTIPPDLFGPDGCGGFGEEANGTAVDDVLVLVNIDSIDGVGGVLAQAGPCGIRDDDLPFIGVLTLDEGDLLPITGSSTLTAVVAHEIGHVLGFGSLWELADLIEGEGTDDPRFTGELAVAEWHALGGTGAVPVENEGGEGTADSHLRENVFDRELMTGFSEPLGVEQPLSRVTVAALADLGFGVDLSAADEFTLNEAPLAPDALRTSLGRDIVGGVGPVHRVPLGKENPVRGSRRR